MAHPLMQFFSFGHLPDHLKAASEPFAVAATAVENCSLDEALPRTTGLERDLARLSAFVAALPVNLESNEALREIAGVQLDLHSEELGGVFGNTTDVLRALLRAKDCAVRAVVYKEPQP